MTYQIVVDSAADITTKEYLDAKYPVKVVPLTIKIGSKEHIDDDSLDTKNLLAEMAASKEKQTTSCPNPGAFEAIFREADYTFCITISSKLSGTYNSACLARDIVKKDGHEVAVIDSKAVAGVERLMTHDIISLLNEGKSFPEVASQIKSENYQLLFVLSSFDNLVKNGRMNKFTGMVASFLSIRPLFCADNGEIKLIKKVRTLTKSLNSLVDEMPNLTPKFSKVVITYVDNLPTAESLKANILAKYANVEVELVPTRGLTTFYAQQNGIIVSFR